MRRNLRLRPGNRESDAKSRRAHLALGGRINRPIDLTRAIFPLPHAGCRCRDRPCTSGLIAAHKPTGVTLVGADEVRPATVASQETLVPTQFASRCATGADAPSQCLPYASRTEKLSVSSLTTQENDHDWD